MSDADELDAIRERYERRGALPTDRYSHDNPEVLARVHERRRALTALLAARGISSLRGLDVIEVGCGIGTNLLELLELGAAPERLVGNELLPDRLARAREVLPPAVRLLPGDAAALQLGDSAFDIVYQSTVFSSILNSQLQTCLAASMWRWLKRGGGVLWYDFTYNNPSNPDVMGVPLHRVRELFPDGQLHALRVTLAPPIARRVTAVHPALYSLFNAVPLLRTHVLCWIQKP
jgi:ubiquinone/menaquinone biosynthesis C-methylase UbiE